MPKLNRVLLTGATGFVGSHCYPALRQAGFEVIPASRRPRQAEQRFPGRGFRHLDLADAGSIRRALQGCDAAVYLVHSMAGGGHYERRERLQAQRFAEAAEAAGIQRIVYLGGVRPAGKPSRHLRSRLRTGECLREGATPTIELRASMIIGPGSDSFRMVRDLAARLPLMLFPRWSRNLTEPIALRDVVFAIQRSLELEQVSGSRVYGLPGPDTLSAQEIVLRTAELMGRQPQAFEVPLVTPRLSSYWVRMVTRARPTVVAELIEGLGSDLLSPHKTFWEHAPDFERTSFEDAVRSALADEGADVKGLSRLYEAAVRGREQVRFR